MRPLLALAAIVLASVGVLLASGASAASSCSVTLASGADVGQAVTANSGGVVCLGSGTYTLNDSVAPAARTTVTAASGASVTFSGDLQASTNVTISNVTVTSAATAAGSSGVTFDGDAFVGPLCIHGTATTVSNSTFDGISSTCGEGRIQVAAGAKNAVITNNHIGAGGCTDGVQLTGDASGTRITNNEFAGIVQDSCTVHSDPIQFYGATNTLVDHNYFHGNSTGIMSPDANGSPMTVTNNVFQQGEDGYCCAIRIGGGHDDVVTGNTFAGGWDVLATLSNQGEESMGETLTSNIVTGGQATPTFAYGPGAATTPPVTTPTTPPVTTPTTPPVTTPTTPPVTTPTTPPVTTPTTPPVTTPTTPPRCTRYRHSHHRQACVRSVD